MKYLYSGDWFFACASWTQGIFAIRLGKRAIKIKAPWNAALFTERERFKCAVLPLGRGWRIIWSAPA